MGFEWDPSKAEANRQKHGITFAEAQTIFPSAEVFDDPSHGGEEARNLVIGFSDKGRLLSVVITYRGENIRIISARKASRQEGQAYAEAKSRKVQARNVNP